MAVGNSELQGSEFESITRVARVQGRGTDWHNRDIVVVAPDIDGAAKRPFVRLPLLGGAAFLVCIGFALWLVYSWSGYARRHAQSFTGWKLGGTQLVEITLVKEDTHNLACASAASVDGLHCRYRSKHTLYDPNSVGGSKELQPLNTVNNELFLGAGLWSSPALSGPLPNQRFTVSCNYHVLGVVKSVSIRFKPTAAFEPAGHTITAGTLENCTIPQ